MSSTLFGPKIDLDGGWTGLTQTFVEGLQREHIGRKLAAVIFCEGDDCGVFLAGDARLEAEVLALLHVVGAQTDAVRRRALLAQHLLVRHRGRPHTMAEHVDLSGLLQQLLLDFIGEGARVGWRTLDALTHVRPTALRGTFHPSGLLLELRLFQLIDFKHQCLDFCLLKAKEILQIGESFVCISAL